MKTYVLSMARFFRNYHTALNLLTDEEFRILAFLAFSHQVDKYDNHYCSIAYL